MSPLKQRTLLPALIGPLALLACLTATAGEVTPPRIAHPWILRAEIDGGGTPFVNLIFTPPNQNSVSALALTLGRNFTEAFSVEATLGADVFPGDIYSPGAESMILGRGALVLDQARRHALTVAAGPMLIAGGTYGPVAFVHTEVGYELHANRWTVLVALGPDLTLTTSRPQSTAGCGGGGIFGPSEPACVRPFTKGDLFVHLRLGVGLTF